MMLQKIMTCIALWLLMILPQGALAAEGPKTFVVMPFTINGPQQYQYLSKGIQDMLVSRLQGKNFGEAQKDLAIAGDKVRKTLEQAGGTTLVWGSATIMGDQASLDIRIQEKKGEAQTKSGQFKMDQLIPALDKISGQIVGSPKSSSGQAGKGDTEKVNTMNPSLVFNERDQKQEFYLNPQFRYAGDSAGEGRSRSQSFPFPSTGMIVGDANNDGKNEIFILDNTMVRAYMMDKEGRLTSLATYEIPNTMLNMAIYMMDLKNDGHKEIIVSAAYKTQKNSRGGDYYEYTPNSYILRYTDKKFEVLAEKIHYYLGVVKSPPRYTDQLIAQKEGQGNLFDKKVLEATFDGQKVHVGGRLSLPMGANVFNFAYLPLDEGKYKIVMNDEKDRIRVYTESGDRQYTSDNVYSGSSLGLEYKESMPGIVDSTLMESHYYMPMRLIPINLSKGQQHELLVNHPVSVAAQFFERYRFFPQGEIQSLTWDGVGLNLVWKTRRIKGSVVDYGIADINNEGVLSLYVCVNSHPGSMGLQNRRTIVLAYPLDTSSKPVLPKGNEDDTRAGTE